MNIFLQGLLVFFGISGAIAGYVAIRTGTVGVFILVLVLQWVASILLAHFATAIRPEYLFLLGFVALAFSWFAHGWLIGGLLAWFTRGSQARRERMLR